MRAFAYYGKGQIIGKKVLVWRRKTEDIPKAETADVIPAPMAISKDLNRYRISVRLGRINVRLVRMTGKPRRVHLMGKLILLGRLQRAIIFNKHPMDRRALHSRGQQVVILSKHLMGRHVRPSILVVYNLLVQDGLADHRSNLLAQDR